MTNLKNRPGILKNRDGAIIPIVAVCLVMMLGCAAIAIDIGMLLDSKAEAQRAADAAALAGASALLEFRSSSEAVRRAAAVQRAENVAGLNVVRDAAVTAAEVGVEFLDSDRRIAATVTRGSIPPLLATIFGVTSLQVSATAHAMYYQGNSASCLKPFGVPDRDPFTLGHVGQEIVIWQKSTHSDYPLVKHLVKDEPGGGSNTRAAIESEVCNNTLVTVGERLELQSGTAPMTGQVEQGLETLYGRDSNISYNPSNPTTHPHDGFNIPDWRASSRIINLVTYDPLTTTTTTFAVTGFLTIFLNRPMQNAPQGDRIQYGIVLPHKAVGGTGVCTPPNCAALSFALRLVQ